MTQARVTEKLVDAAIEVLATMLRFEQPADAALSRHFREHKLLGQRERAFIAETAYSVLRHKRSLSRLCGDKPTPRKLLLAALVRLQGLSVRQFGDIASARERTWLEDLRAGPEGEVSLAERADFPDWLVDKLLPACAAEADPDAAVLALARGLNQSAPLDLRINPMKTNREDALAALAASGIEGEACRYAPLGIRLKEKPALGKHPLFIDGAIEVQDEGSQLLGHLLAPKRGEMVVDFCAGAGGKTLLLGALMRSTGRLYAFDTSDRRLAKLKPRMARSGLSNVHPAALASEHDSRVKRLAGKIDRVLVDAPCSGLGTLRRNPDLKWRQTEGSIAELTAKQAR
ncbi:MAG TPA: RsmB/NOP family class I SAM-dependent RNA methyltransferase, partial [Rhodocyclaceae bacterium]